MGIEKSEAKILVYRYGSNIDVILNRIKELQHQQQSIPPIIQAQLEYCMNQEMCLTPSDFFIRRTGALFFNVKLVKTYKDKVFDFMKNYLNWDNGLDEKYKADLETALQEVA